MQLSHLIGAGALIAAFGLLTSSAANDAVPSHSPAAESANTESATVATPVAPPEAPPANGHYVLVVEGDRNGLQVTFASKKPDPWGGVPKAFNSNWRLSVRDARDQELADVPLDVRPFATSSRSLGKPVQVMGCIVVDSKIGMLVNVPAFAAASSYKFVRIERDGTKTNLGVVAAQTISDLAGEPR